MQPAGPQFLPAETISWMWWRLHQDAGFAFSSSEAYYLRTLAVAGDDDLSSLLLLKKLKLARQHARDEMPADVVALNSFLEFTFDARPKRFCQIVHSSVSQRTHGLSVSSRLGIGLVGLCSGQTILWPDEQDVLKELQVHAVQAPAVRRVSGLACRQETPL